MSPNHNGHLHAVDRLPPDDDESDGKWPVLNLRPSQELVLVPDAVYEVKSLTARPEPSVGGRHKFFIRCVICEGEHAGRPLRFIATIPKEGREISIASRLYAAWMVFRGGIAPTVRERFDTKVFRDRLVQARTRTVTHDAGRALKLGHLQYSVIDWFLPLIPAPAAPSDNGGSRS